MKCSLKDGFISVLLLIMVTASEGTNFPLFLHRNTVMQTPNNFRGYSPMRNILQDLDSFPDDSDTQRKLHKIVKKQMAVSDYKKKNKRSVLTVLHGGGGSRTELNKGAVSIIVPGATTAAAAPPKNPAPIREQDLLDKMASSLLQRLYEDIKNRLIEEQINSRVLATGKQDQVGVKMKEKEGFSGREGGVKPGKFSSAATKQLPAPLNIVPLVRLKIEPPNNANKELVNRIKIVPVGPHGKAPAAYSDTAPTIQLNVASTNNQQKAAAPASNFNNELASNPGGSVVSLKLPSRNNYKLDNTISTKIMNNQPILNLQIPTGGVAPVSNINCDAGKHLNSPFGSVNRVPTIHINATLGNTPALGKHIAIPLGSATRPPFIRFGSSRKHATQPNAIAGAPMLNLEIASNNQKGSTSLFSFGPPMLPLNRQLLGLSPAAGSDVIGGSATVEKPPLPRAPVGQDTIRGIPGIILTPESSLPLFRFPPGAAPEVVKPPPNTESDLKTALENAHKNALASAYSHAVAKAMGQLKDVNNLEPSGTKLDETNHREGRLEELVTEKPPGLDGDHLNIKSALESILANSGHDVLKFTPENPPLKTPENDVKQVDDISSHKKGLAVMNIVRGNPQENEFRAAIGKNGLAVVKITQETNNPTAMDFKTALENILRRSQMNNGATVNGIPVRGFEFESSAQGAEQGGGFNLAKGDYGGEAQVFDRFKCDSTTPAQPKNFTKVQSLAGNAGGVTNVISITFANLTAPKESQCNGSGLKAYQVAPLRAFKVAPLEAFKISPLKTLRLAPPLYSTPPGQLTDFDLAINEAINNALANVLNSPGSQTTEQQNGDNSEHHKGLPAPVNFLYQPVKHNHVETTMPSEGTKCMEEPKWEDLNFGVLDVSKENAKPEGELTEVILKRLKEFVNSAQKFIPEKDFLFKKKEAKSEKGKELTAYRKSSVIIPDQNDLHCYYECEAMPFGCMKLRHKQCPRGEFFSIKHQKCLKMSYWKSSRRKKAVSEISKKVDFPENPDDAEPSNEWMDANGPNQKIPAEFKPKRKPMLKIYHLRVRRNRRHESKKAPGKREAVLNRGKGQGMLAKNPSKGLSKRQGFHKHHPRSFLIRINKKEGKHNRDSISDNDENDSEDDEEGDEDEDDEEDPDESEEEPEDDETDDDGAGKTKKPSRAESIKEFFKSAKAAMTNRAKFTEPTMAAAEDGNKGGSSVKSGRKSGNLAGGKSAVEGKPKQVLLDASIKVDSAFSSALRSILKSKRRDKNVEVENEGLISDRGSQDQLDPELLRVYQHLIRSDPRVKRHYRGKFDERGH